MAIRLRRRRAERPSPDAMTLVQHLGELRYRLIVAIMAILVGGVVAFALYNHILHFFVSPYCQVAGPRHCSLFITSPLDGFSIRLKIAAYGGLVLASPIVLWQLWRFVTPGLHPNEKRYAVPFVTCSLLLFALGGFIAYNTFPKTLRFLDAVGGPNLQQIFSPNSYLSLIVVLMFAFGLTFEFPVLLVALQAVGVLTPARLSSWRRYAIVIMVAAAAIITPSPDPFSMLALAVPMVVFYEASILIGKLIRR